MKQCNYSLLFLLWSLFQTLKIASSQQSQFVTREDYGFHRDTLECADNIDCIVSCYSYKACYRSTIIGPSNAKLTINCNSDGRSLACRDCDIYAQDSTELRINVYNERYEFYYNNIYTRNNPQSPSINTFISCGIIGANNDNSPQSKVCYANIIYSVNGWESVKWTFAGDASWSSTTNLNTMRCGTNYLQSCFSVVLDDFDYGCTDPLSICDYDRSSEIGEVHFISYFGYGWNGATIQCIDDIDCVVNCFRANACREATIIGPSNAKLIINCNSGYDSSPGYGCVECDIYAQNSTELHINVYNEQYEFRENNIYTPNHPQSPTINTVITCGIIGEDNDHTMKEKTCSYKNNIYSINGWQSVNWTYAGNAGVGEYHNHSNQNTMHCGTDYLESCSDFKLDGTYYRCATQSECGTVRPTNAPSSYPTVSVDIDIFQLASSSSSPSSRDIVAIICGAIALVCCVIILIVIHLKQRRKEKEVEPPAPEQETKVPPSYPVDTAVDTAGGNNIELGSVDNQTVVASAAYDDMIQDEPGNDNEYEKKAPTDGGVGGEGGGAIEDGVVKTDSEMDGEKNQ